MRIHQLALAFALVALGARLSDASSLTVAMTATVASVFAGPNPAIDSPNPPPAPDSAFEQFFSTGQAVSALLNYDNDAVDWDDQQNIPTPKIGIYRAISGGSVTIAGETYAFDFGDVSAQLMNNLGEDQLAFDATGPAIVNQPITANKLQLVFGIAKSGMLASDALPQAMPPTWTRGFGHVRFGTGNVLLYELQLSITSVTTVPEPPGLALMLFACCVARSTVRSGSRVRGRA